MKKYLLLLILILVFSVNFIIGDTQNPESNKYWINTWTEVEELGNGKFGATVHVGHRVFKDKADGQYKKHKLTDERPGKDYVLIQSAKCCVEVYPYYAKYFDINHEEVRLYEERWVVQQLFETPDKWKDVDAWNPVITIEETDNSITVNISYTTDYGSLIVKYIQRNGTTLKHDVMFTNNSGSIETFRVLQKWAGIVGDKCNGKDIPVIEDVPYLVFHDSDKPKKKFNIAENLCSMIFNEDGSEKIDQCLQRPISIESHAQGMKADFIYGNWILAQDESLEIDPDTATLDDPTEDGFVTYNGETYTKDTGLDYFYAGFVDPNIYRGYVEWNVSSIPEGVIVTDAVFKYHGNYNSEDSHIHECVGQRPSTADYEALYNEIGDGTVYADPDGFPVVGINQQVDLGTSADSDLESQLSVGWFAIGVQSDSEVAPLGFSRIHCEDFPGTPNPTLYVEYEEAPEVNVIFFSTPF